MGLKQTYCGSETLAEIWGDFIDWEKRLKGPDVDFLINQLRIKLQETILDSSLGDGIDSVHLLQQGFRVASNEIDPDFIQKALENAEKHGVTLDISQHNWLEIDQHFLPNSFGGIICLGNSITYLFTKEEQLKALQNFQNLLSRGGRLIIDERNYQYLLDDREEILKGNFRYSRDYVYHGQKVHASPVSITDNEVIMEYKQIGTGKKGYLRLYPFKKGELLDLLRQVDFSEIRQFSDYEPGYNSQSDFHQYVCIK